MSPRPSLLLSAPAPDTLSDRLRRFWKQKRFYFLIPLVAALLFAALEYFNPYYFLQDDTRVQFIPVLAHCMGALKEGSVAFYNFHQHLGVPVLSAGVFGVLYPFTYIAAWLSYLFFGHIFAAADFWAAIHIILGGYGMFFLLRKMGLTKRVAFFGSVSWMLNPYVVFAGSSWWSIMPAVGWFPWMLYWSAELVDFSPRHSMFFSCAARIMLFFGGHVQFFIYSVVAEILFIVLREFFSSEKKISRAALHAYVLSYVITFVLSLPLLLPLFQQVRLAAGAGNTAGPEQARIGANNVLMWLAGVAYPFSSQWLKEPVFSGLVEMFAPRASWQVWFLPYFSHLGYCVLFLCLLCWLPAKKREDSRYGILSALLGLAFLLWSFGILDGVIGAIPVLRAFRYPFKVLLFANFFFILLACVNLSSVNELVKRKRRARWMFAALTVVQIGQLLFLYCVSPRRNFVVYSGPLPAAAPFAAELAAGRIFSLGAPAAGAPGSVALAGYNYASLFGLYQFGGYDALLPRYNFQITGPVSYSSIVDIARPELARVIPLLRQWGVRNYIVAAEQEQRYKETFALHGIVRRGGDAECAVYRDPQALPLAYLAQTGSGDGIKHRIGTNSITVESDLPKGGPVAVAFAYNPQFEVYVDGREMPVIKTAQRQLGVYMGSGRHRAVFRYSDTLFWIGLWVAAAFLALVVLYKSHGLINSSFRKRFSRNLVRER
ncbi:MAG: hypothetical protein PHW69_07255 [Elusimicrobiaceae bacterium]|nr:hypothetical protein [Elusimicrobiaceae bacterium]